MNTIELFAGSCEISEYIKRKWHKTFAIDYIDFGKIDKVLNIYNLSLIDIPYIPDFWWASPDCTTYSIAACSTHRNKDKTAKSDYAKVCDEWNKHWINIMLHFLQKNKNMKVVIENPSWNFKHMDFIKNLKNYWFKCYTVWYCQYWDTRAKPTNIFTNITNWIPRKKCHNYKYDENWNIIDRHCHHESARRWSKTWTQWLKNSYERSKIPKQLYEEIFNCLKTFDK